MAASSPDVLSGRDGACIAAVPPKHTPSLNTSSAPQATAPRTARSPAPPRRRERERRIQEAMLGIKKKFGKNAVLKGTNYLDGATMRERNGQIGGHKAK